MSGIVWGSACRVGTVGMVSDMGNYLHAALWVVAQVDHIAGLPDTIIALPYQSDRRLRLTGDRLPERAGPAPAESPKCRVSNSIHLVAAPPDILYIRRLARVQGSESGVAGLGAGGHQ